MASAKNVAPPLIRGTVASLFHVATPISRMAALHSLSMCHVKSALHTRHFHSSTAPSAAPRVTSHVPPIRHALHSRHFRSSAALSFKYKIKIKDPDENQAITPLDYDSVPVPGFSSPDMEKEDDLAAPRNRTRDAVYQRNLQRKMAYNVDPKTRARTMKSWPMVSMGINALKDSDIPQGIKFNVVYHDTHAYERHSGPIVLILHGLRLPAANFTPLIEPLVEQGYRVIAPIFPLIGHNVFKPNVNLVTTAKEMSLFSHSTIERGILITDFIEALLPRGRKVDVLVAADLGSYPALWIGAHANLAKSLLFLDAFPAAPIAVTKPQFLLRLMCKLYEHRAYFPLAFPYMGYVMARVFGSTSVKEASAHARAIAFADYPLLEGALTTLEMKGMPAVVYAGRSNKFVPLDDAREFIRRLGIEDRFVVDLEEAAAADLSASTSTSSISSSTSPTSSSLSSSDVVSVDSNIFDRTLTHSCARIFSPREQDDFGKYNRRHAKADWFHLPRQITNDIVQLAKRVNAS